jgi:HD superfamily phosphohydrolase
MTSILEIPEIAGLDSSRGLIRIPPETDVPLTPRVRRLIDAPQFRRLAHVSQLGLVALVYPAANHTRFEHSLGVYRLALLYLRRLSYDARFARVIDRSLAERFIAAALLHDLGHWPFCHPIEDLHLDGVPRHESFAERFLAEGELADALAQDWGVEPGDVARLLSSQAEEPAGRILSSMLSGPVDIDKMDYLARDSLHCGVPYGRNFDQGRLIASLCLNEAGDGLAITDKGRTAAELIVFARYVMFSEVYWHHAVRAATAMLQRAFFLLRDSLDLERLFRFRETALIEALKEAAGSSGAGELLDGLSGSRRKLYKRVVQFSILEEREFYQRLARRPYPWLVRCAERFAELAGKVLKRQVPAHHVLFDAPPVQREVEFDVDVYFNKQARYRPLAEVSPVVRTLAREQFDDYVKRVRLFAHPRLAGELRQVSDLSTLLTIAIEQAG